MSEHDPYTPPESDLRPKQERNFIQNFPRFPTLLFVGIGIFTMGLFVYYWIYTRNQMLNRCLPDSLKMPEWLVNSTVILGVIGFVMSCIQLIMPNTALAVSTSGAQAILGLLSFALALVWLFNFRSQLNRLSGAAPGDAIWVNGLLLFLFTTYYLQYKINQIHDLGPMSPPSSGVDDEGVETSKQGTIEL